MKKIVSVIVTCLLATMVNAQAYHWAKSIGGATDEQGICLDVDASGNTFTTGYFTGTVDFDPGPGTISLTAVGGDDAFVLKMDPSGNLLWVRSFGGTSTDHGYYITIDAAGNVYTTGWFYGTVDFDPGAGISNRTAIGGSNVFVHKMDASGNFIWAGSFGGAEGLSIAVDNSGNVYTTGSFGGTVDFDPGQGIANLTGHGGWDIFVHKMDASGNFIWAKSFGSTGSDHGWSIATDASGNVYSTGNFKGTADFDPGTGIANRTSAGDDDIYVQKLDPSGNFLWIKSFGGAATDNVRSMTIDDAGDVYTTGTFEWTADFDPGTGITNLTPLVSRDVFVQKMDASGDFLWAKSFGGTDSEQGYSITTDASGNVYTTGWFVGTTDFDPGPGTANYTSTGAFDIFVHKMDASGNFLWAKSFGGTSSEIGYSIAVDGSENVYTTGWFAGTADFNPGTGIANRTSAGGGDIFIQKLRQCTPTTGVDEITTCNPYTWIDGNTYTISNNTATHDLTNATGCDSTVTLNLTINSNISADIVAACDTYVWIDGNTYTVSNNTATHVLTNANGCDSTVTLNLTIYSSTGTAVITACDSYTWIDGNTYTASNNTVTHTLTNAAQCDSIVTLNLTITHSSSGTAVITACDSYTWIDGNTYTASNNTATYTLTNAAQCDSIVTLNLTITHSSSGTAVITACDAYTWIDGNTYTASNNTASHTLTNVAQCDSIVTLNLTITHSSSGTAVITACDSYTWIDGNTYTASNNTATYTLTNAAQCDSIVTLNLTITHSSSSTAVITACDAYTWIDGNTYTASNNTASHTLTNVAQCDSVVTLNLTIHSVSDITMVLTGIYIVANNANATYQWLDCDDDYAILSGETSQDFTATVNGNYAVELTENGCVDTSACVAIKTVGIPEHDFRNEMNIFPNPTDGNFSIDLGSVYEHAGISITDITGKVIDNISVTQAQVVSLSIDERAGFYFVTVYSGKKKVTFKLMKE